MGVVSLCYSKEVKEMVGKLSILNVGRGDTKITFDEEGKEKAKQVITDMLKMGYALLVEVERDGKKAYERVKKFDPKKLEYIISEEATIGASPRKRKPTRRIKADAASAVAVGRSAGG
jgi:uncharacterized radical SAM superfamily Fe-S cluster-containing enzyme